MYRASFLIRYYNGFLEPQTNPYHAVATGLNGYTSVIDESTAAGNASVPVLVNRGLEFSDFQSNMPYHIEFSNIAPGYYLTMPDFQVSSAFLATMGQPTGNWQGQFAMGINHVFSNAPRTGNFTIRLYGGRPGTSPIGTWFLEYGWSFSNPGIGSQKHPLAGVSFTLHRPNGQPETFTTDANGYVTLTNIQTQTEYDLVMNVPLPEGIPVHLVFSLPPNSPVCGYEIDINSGTNLPQTAKILTGVFTGYIGGQGNNIQIGDEVPFRIPTRNINGSFRVSAVTDYPTPIPTPGPQVILLPSTVPPLPGPVPPNPPMPPPMP